MKVNGNLLEGTDSQVINWFFTISFWIATIITLLVSENIIGNVIENIKSLDVLGLIKNVGFDVIVGFYIIYLLFQFFTTGFRKFMRFHSFHTVLKNNIENKFKIKYHGVAWHTVTERDSDGNETTRDIITFDKKIEYFFKSGADYSVINIDPLDINSSRYFDLEIEYDFIALDKNTFEGENKAYNDFYNMANCDESCSVCRIIDVKNSHSKNIISLTNCFIVFFDRLIYLICIFLSIGQIFKHIISCFMSKKKIKITKIISNYYDLTQADFFFYIQPKVNLLGEKMQYDREKFAFKNNQRLEIMISNNNPLNSKFKNYNNENNNINISNNYNTNNNNIDINNNIENDDNKKTEMEKLIITTI